MEYESPTALFVLLVESERRSRMQSSAISFVAHAQN